MSDAFESWHRDGRTFNHGPHPIFYREAGTGPVLLAIHGFPSASWDWHPLWPELTSRFRVVAPDLIGFGWSAKPRPYAYSILDQATILEGLLAELGITRAHLLAHDYGDTVAQELLARTSDRAKSGHPGLMIESACLLNGGVFPEAHRPLQTQKLLAGPLGPLMALFMRKGQFHASLTRIFGRSTPPSDQLIDELWTLLSHHDGQRVIPAILGYMAERRRYRERWVGALLNAAVPLRLIDGTADPISGAHLVARYRELVPKADIVELPQLGHYPQVEDPSAVLKHFLAFHRLS